MHCPYVVVAIDVETSGWDHTASFLAQNRHMGPPPCVVNHRQDKGAICQIGWCVFRRVGSGQYRYEQPHSVTVQWPAMETISATLKTSNCFLRGEPRSLRSKRRHPQRSGPEAHQASLSATPGACSFGGRLGSKATTPELQCRKVALLEAT